MRRETWRCRRAFWDLDDDGYGAVVYEIDTAMGILSFVAFSDYLRADERTDRVIAEKWDTTFTLMQGSVDRATVARLRTEVPKQEAGRCGSQQLVLSRANRSVRLFDYVVACLSAGKQPDASKLAAVGYLLRTTAVYGNGKFGLADFQWVQAASPFSLPFQAELLTVFISRQLSFDLVNHIAQRRNPDTAVSLSRNFSRALGVGNATGLGMAPFLISHPKLIHQWIHARELAIARVRAVAELTPEHATRFAHLLERAIIHVQQWHTDDTRQQSRIRVLLQELLELAEQSNSGPDWLATAYPWDSLAQWAAQHVSLETVELLNSLMLELHPEIVDVLEATTGIDEAEAIIPHMNIRDLQNWLRRRYGWALDIDFGQPESDYFFWYVSEEKEEPRLGERRREPGADKELRIGIAREVKRLSKRLETYIANDDVSVAEFLNEEPQWRFIVRRVQALLDFPYAEIRDNTLGQECLAIDLLRCKLSVFGATHFDPKSDRWTRITLFQGAPLADEFDCDGPDDWCFPIFPGQPNVAPGP